MISKLTGGPEMDGSAPSRRPGKTPISLIYEKAGGAAAGEVEALAKRREFDLNQLNTEWQSANRTGKHASVLANPTSGRSGKRSKRTTAKSRRAGHQVNPETGPAQRKDKRARTMVDFSNIRGFEWDEGNERKSAEKHEVSNAEAEQVFANSPRILPDPEHSQDEPRHKALGETDQGRRLFVSFTIRKAGTKIRVISARPMSRRERLQYDNPT